MGEKKTILYVDDEPLNLLVFSASFKLNYNVIVANNGDECLLRLEESEVDFLISDMQMPGMNGVELIGIVKEKHPEMPCFILTGYDCNEEITNAINQGLVSMYFSKPFDKDFIERQLEAANV